MGKVRSKLGCGAIVWNPLFMGVVEIFEKSQKLEAQDFLLKTGSNSYKGFVYHIEGLSIENGGKDFFSLVHIDFAAITLHF